MNTCDFEQWGGVPDDQLTWFTTPLFTREIGGFNTIIRTISLRHPYSYCSRFYKNDFDDDKFTLVEYQDHAYVKMSTSASRVSITQAVQLQFVYDYNGANKVLQEVEYQVNTDFTCQESLQSTLRYKLDLVGVDLSHHRYHNVQLSDVLATQYCLTQYTTKSVQRRDGAELVNVTGTFELKYPLYGYYFQIYVVNPAVPIATYEIKIKVLVGGSNEGDANQISELIIEIELDKCLSIFNHVSKTHHHTVDPTNALRSGVPLTVDLPNLDPEVHTCNFSSITSTAPTLQLDASTVVVPSLARGSSSIKITFEPITLLDKTPGDYKFTVTFVYKHVSSTIKYKLTVPNPCADHLLEMTTNCELEQTPTLPKELKYGVETDFTLRTPSCSFTYTPSGCPTDRRQIHVTLPGFQPDTQYFSRAKGSPKPGTRLVESATYTWGDHLSVAVEPASYYGLQDQDDVGTFQLDISYGNDRLTLTWRFKVVACPCASFTLNNFGSNIQQHPTALSVPIQAPLCNNGGDPGCQVLPDMWEIQFDSAQTSPGLGANYALATVPGSLTQLVINQSPEVTQDTTETIKVKYRWKTNGAFVPQNDQEEQLTVQLKRQERCNQYDFSDSEELQDFDYTIGQPLVTQEFFKPKCLAPNHDRLFVESEFDYNFGAAKVGSNTPHARPTWLASDVHGDVKWLKVHWDQSINADEQQELVVTATSRDDPTKKAEKKIIVNFKCRCLDFAIDMSTTFTQVYGKDPIKYTVPEPKCALPASCARPLPEAWQFSHSLDGTYTTEQSQSLSQTGTAPEYTFEQKSMGSVKEEQFSVILQAQVVDYITGFSGNKINVTASIKITLVMQWCECESYALGKIEDVTKTYKELNDAKFTIPAPQCTDMKALSISGCEQVTDWRISLLVGGDEKKVPAEVSVLEREVTIKPPLEVLLAQTTTKIEIFNRPALPAKFIGDYRVEKSFNLDFMPCWCDTYTFDPIEGIDHQFGDPLAEISFKAPTCSGDSTNCLVASTFTYTATLADTTPLPIETQFLADKKLFRVDQLLNPAYEKTIDVVLKATTDEVTSLAAPIEAKFAVKLTPRVDTGITVEPSLSATFEMPFNSTFEQLFTFKSREEGEELDITALKHPFIQTKIGNGNVLVSVDGPYVLNFTKVEDDKTDQIKITVNEQRFTFSIKLLYPKKDTADSTSSDTDSQSKYAISITPEVKQDNAGARLYNFIPRKRDENAERQQIKAQVSKIEKNGAISIQYDPPIANVPTDWKKYFVEEELSKLDFMERREREEKAKEIMHVTFVQNSEEKPQLFFVSNLTSFTPEGIQIHLNFSDPLFVSQGEMADHVRIKLRKDFFMSPESGNSPWDDQLRRNLGSLKSYDDGYYLVFIEELPLLMASQAEYEELSDQVGSTKNVMEAQFITSFLLQLFLSGALSMLWNIFNTLQIILAMNLLMVSFPANVKFFQEQIEDLINLEIIPKDFLYDNLMQPLLKLETSEQKKQRDSYYAQKQAEKDVQPASRGLFNKFFGTSILMNVLTVLLLLCLFIAVVSLVLCCKHTVMPKCPSCFTGLIAKIEHKIFWNSILRACLETYFSTAIFFFYSMRTLDSNDQEGRIEVITWLAIGTFLFYFPFGTFRVLFSRWGKLQKVENRQRFDSLYQNVEVHKGPIAFAFSLYFCLRRLAFAFVIAQVHCTIVYQIFLLDLVSTLMLAYFITIQPMADRLNNAIQIFNELVVLICIHSMFLFTNYVPNPEVRYSMGQKVLYLIAGNVAVNLFVLIIVLLRKVVNGIQTWYKQRQLKQAMQFRLQQKMQRLAKQKENQRKAELNKKVQKKDFASRNIPLARLVKPIGALSLQNIIGTSNGPLNKVHEHSVESEASDSEEHQASNVQKSSDSSQGHKSDQDNELEIVAFSEASDKSDDSWVSSFSDTDSDEDAPTREQIQCFSDPAFQQEMINTEIDWRHDDASILKPHLFNQLTVYQGFLQAGYKFSTQLRAAKKIDYNKQAKKIPLKRSDSLKMVNQQAIKGKTLVEEKKTVVEMRESKINLRRRQIVTSYFESDVGKQEPSVDQLYSQFEELINSNGNTPAAPETNQDIKLRQMENMSIMQQKRKSRYLLNLFSSD